MLANTTSCQTVTKGRRAPRPMLNRRAIADPRPAPDTRTPERDPHVPLVTSHDIYLSHQVLIERTLARVCWRQHLSPADGEDFSSSCRLHLMDADYAIIRAFQGRSSLQTYLITVITHFFQDWRNARWGKWRPSAEARRLGPLAVRLETLLVRDGLTLDEAFETLRTNFKVVQSRQVLEEIAARFPSRWGRTFVSDDGLDQRPSIDTRPDATLERRHAAAVARGATSVMAAAIAKLPPGDRLILEMRFQQDRSIADIARRLDVDQKPLYRRLARLLTRLRTALQATGLTASVAAAALAQGGFDLIADGDSPGTAITRPAASPSGLSAGPA